MLRGSLPYYLLIAGGRIVGFFQVVAMSVLLSGCTTWTLMKPLEKKLDGNDTKMLCGVF